MISRYDHLLVGLLAAFVVATLGFAVSTQAVEFANQLFDLTMDFRQRSLALIGICLNVLPLNYFQARYWNKSLRGLVIGTFLLAMAWFFNYGQDLLDGSAGY
ncbi:hypothetical protein [Neolewinella antarctica]|uniref:Uncharacterized protein n=1 Tax=Neolewinella antarctica TaxID=442734 RepID=A0ABX0XFN9_9BACT|nr:hypothetical protein [Neolewinella antarctica]NJC28125.1 hypothetical protein [Neolewinella antarctica]